MNLEGFFSHIPKRLALLAVLLSTAFFPLFSDVAKEATEVFMENRPEEAIHLLRTALEKEPENAELYMYLGIAYEQLGDWEAAVDAFEEGLSTGKKRASFLFNIANNYARLQRYEEAERSFSAAIEAGSMAAAYLNRANLRVREEKFQAAVSDYRMYLSLRPKARQRDKIEEMISLLSKKLRVAEEQRREDARRQKEEKERQEALLDQVLNSLEESSGETKNLSAGTGEVKEYEEDFDIVE